MAAIETMSPNAGLLEETTVLKETAAIEEVEEPAPPAVTPGEKAEKEVCVHVETVAEPPNSEASDLNEKVETPAEELEKEEEEEEEVVILTDEEEVEEESEAVAEVMKEESDCPNESLAPEADAPAAEAKEEDERKEAPAEKTEYRNMSK